MSGRRMSFRDAIDLVPDDLPDGAFWAMAHEIAGLDYGEGFDELAKESLDAPPNEGLSCGVCGRSFGDTNAAYQHRRDKHRRKK